MIRRLVARGLLSVVLAAALFSLFRLPAGAATVYQEITGMEELTSGQYVLVTPLGDAPGILLGEDFVISATKPTFTGDTVAAGAEWNLTVTENRVILTDAHGVSAAPLEGDTFFLRQHPKTLSLPFRADLGRPNRDNVIDGYINGNEEDVCADGIWQNYFTRQPDRLTEEDKREFLSKFDGVSLGSDAFFPFPDNIKRAKASGVKYIAQPGGSIRDDLVIEECDKDGMVMAFTGMRLFHH